MENVAFVYKEGVSTWKGLELAPNWVQKNFSQWGSLVLNFGNYIVPRIVPEYEELFDRSDFFVLFCFWIPS